MRTVKRVKKSRVWRRTVLPLVLKLPNSTWRVFPGNWKRRPGESSMNSNTPTSMGAQSNIIHPAYKNKIIFTSATQFYKVFCRFYGLIFCWRIIMKWNSYAKASSSSTLSLLLRKGSNLTFLLIIFANFILLPSKIAYTYR